MPLVLPGEESGFDEPGRRFERHHHLQAYAALVVAGSCEEAGDRGRFAAVVGDVLVHRAFDGHADRIGLRGAAFLNFPLKQPLAGRFGRVNDPDAIARAWQRDPRDAALLLQEQFKVNDPGAPDWPDLLALDLGGREPVSIVQWADSHGLHPASVSRGFRLAYGISPKRYRVERLVSRAARRVRNSCDSISAIAAEVGFADQAHMTRMMKATLGVTPAALRRLR